MRKFISYLLAIALIVFSIPLTVFAAENIAIYTVSNVSATAGETVQMSVTIDNQIDGGFIQGGFSVTYDSEYLTLSNVTPGEAIKSYSSEEGYGFGWFERSPGNAEIYYNNDDFVTPITASGEIAVLTFSISENVTEGSEYSVTLGTRLGTTSWFFDTSWSEMSIVPTINAGTITVGAGDNADVAVATYTVSNVSATAGETIQVPVTIDNQIDGGFIQGNFSVTYNSEYLTLSNVTPGEAIKSYSSEEGYGFGWFERSPGNAEIYYNNDDFVTPITVSGEIAVLTFSISENADKGSEYSVTLGTRLGTTSWFFDINWSEMSIVPIINAGTITVGDATVGAPAAGGGQATIDGTPVDYAWSYGGSISEENGIFTITPYTADGVNYVIDAVYVDGTAVEVTDPSQTMTVTNASSSVFASFAYTLTF